MVIRRLALCIILIAPGLTGFTGISVTDSLKEVIKTQPDNAAKAAILVQITRNLLGSEQLDSAFVYCDQALELSESIDYLEGRADAYYLKCLIYKDKQDFKTALSLADKYLELYQTLNDSLKLAKGLYNLGVLLMDSGDYDLGLFYAQKSLNYSLALNDSVLILANYNCVGSIYKNGTSMSDSAAYYFLKALEITEKKGNRYYTATILNNLGSTFISEKEYGIAKKYLEKSLGINQSLEAWDQIALNYNNLGRIASAENDTSGAMVYYRKSLDIYAQRGNEYGIADVNTNMGDLFFKEKKFNQALEKFDQALASYKKINVVKGIVTAQMNKSAVYSMMDKLSQALALQDSCLALTDEMGDKRLRMMVMKNIAVNHEKSGKFRQAYEMMIELADLTDKVYDIEKTRATFNLLIKYEKEQDQARILILEKENLVRTNERNMYLFLALGIIVVTLFLFIYFRERSKHEQEITRQKILQLEEEKKLMAARLLVEGQEEERKRIASELHDGLGILLSVTKMRFSTIRDSSPENKELLESASSMLEQASGEVRRISHNMMPGLLTKLGFYEAVEDLFERVGDSGEIKVTCNIIGNQERLPENKEIMLYRIIQELVNNTLRHAEAKIMSLGINIRPDKLEITFSDDGKGFDYKEKMESGSIGLKSIQSRVNFLNGVLMFDTRPGNGLHARIVIPTR